jgi:predicted nucleotidyltransferase
MTDLRSRLPPAARALLERAGVTDEQLEPLLRWEGDGLVLVGSAVEGFLTPESDLDFLVLREESEPLDDVLARRGLGEDVGQRSTLVDRILALVEGVEIDVWILARDRFAPLEETLARSVDPDGRIGSLPGLQYLEQKALSRLHGAVPVYGEAALARWREALRVEWLPAIVAAQMLVEALSYLEDAAALLGLGEELGSAIATRAAGERLVQGALAAAGVVGWDLRYAGLHRERLRAGGAAVPAALDRLEELLFPPRPLDASAALDRALDTAEGLLAEVDRNAADYVRAFGKGRWKLPRDVL